MDNKIFKSYIIAADTEEVEVFVNNSINKEFSLDSNIELNYTFCVYKTNNFHLKFNLVNDNAKAKVKILCLSKDNEAIIWKCEVLISWTHNECEVEIISLVGNGGNVEIDWNIHIVQQAKKAKWLLNKRSVFLSEKGKSQLLPTLLIDTNDVQAGHGASIHRLDTAKRFYLQSKGINFQEANELMIKWYIASIIQDEDSQNTLLNYIIAWITH